MNKWLEQYKKNYEGKSEEALELKDYVKETYNGATYIPWATMERLTYSQDPNATFVKVRNENGGLIHTDSFVNENVVEGKDGTRNASKALVVSHFVKVSCTFMGKEFVEEYPIQEQDYSAAKIYNQNLVNKALQRALAKVASRATGLGLKLYENKDLQYEEDKEEDKKPVVKKTTKKSKVEEPVVEEPVVEEHIVVEDEPKENVDLDNLKEETTDVDGVYSKEIVDLCNLIKNADKEKMTKVLKSLNVSILKKHNFTLSLEDEDNVLCEKLTHFDNTEVFTKAIKTMLGE